MKTSMLTVIKKTYQFNLKMMEIKKCIHNFGSTSMIFKLKTSQTKCINGKCLR